MKIPLQIPRFSSLRSIAGLTATAMLFSLAACEVKKKEDGEAPKVNVDPGKLPKYDVKPAKVEVTTEQKTITVPKVDVKMPSDATPTPATVVATPTP